MIGLFLLIITIMIVVDDNENDIRILNSWNRDDDDDDDKAYVRICVPKCEENYGNGGGDGGSLWVLLVVIKSWRIRWTFSISKKRMHT